MSRNPHFVVGASHPDPNIARGAAQYADRMGLRSAPRHFSSVIAHPAMTERIAQQYYDAPMHDDRAISHFEAMRRETGQQYDFLTSPRRRGGLGVDVSVQHTNPYDGGPGEMMSDLRENRRLKVLSTESTGGHPFFSNEENDQFRAVHDAFGHAGTGRGFDRHGEEAAFQAHSRMFTPIARRAMTTETRGQNSAYITAGGGDNFQPQKLAVLPEASSRIITPLAGRRTLAAQAEAARMHRAQFPVTGRQFGSV